MTSKAPVREHVEQAKWIKSNLHKLVKDLTSEKYHGLIGTWSSSQFKDLIDDEEVFIKKYIKKEIPRTESEAFDTGTYFHTKVLEPHKLDAECAMYPGKVRAGSEWEKFKAKHGHKAIITAKGKEQGDNMARAVADSPVSMQYLKGDPEVSLFIELLIYQGTIYAPYFRKMLTPQGWVDSPNMSKSPGYRIIVKVRADMLGEDFVSDLKSTSGNARSEFSVRQSISKYKYDLSASLYLDMFSLMRPEVSEFIWIFASKNDRSAAAWRATDNQILVGRAKYSRAMVKLADCAAANWEIVDCLRQAEPLPHEMEWLRERDTDLL